MPHRFLIGSIAVVAALALTGPAARSQTVDPGDAVVLVTLDGARTEEIFGGLDLDVLKSTLKPVTNRSACGGTAARVAATVPESSATAAFPRKAR